MHGARGRHTLGHVAQVRENVGEDSAPRQAQADATVARQVPGAGQHQIAEPRQTHQRFALSTECGRQPSGFGEPPGNERCARVVAEGEPVAYPGGDRQHVLDRAAGFHAGQVVTHIGAEGVAAQKLSRALGQFRIGRRHTHRRGQSTSDLFGEARPGNHPHGRRPLRRNDLVRKRNPRSCLGVRDEALAHPQQRHGGAAG